jgi:hypothetical protein
MKAICIDELKEKLVELGFNENFFGESELTELGIKKNTIDELIFFCEVKKNEYWVDCPVSVRDDETKECAKKCNIFKKLLKELKVLKKSYY